MWRYHRSWSPTGQLPKKGVLSPDLNVIYIDGQICIMKAPGARLPHSKSICRRNILCRQYGSSRRVYKRFAKICQSVSRILPRNRQKQTKTETGNEAETDKDTEKRISLTHLAQAQAEGQ